MRMRKKSLEIWWFDWEMDWRRLARWLLPTPGNVLFILLVVGGLLWATSAGALPFRAPLLSSDSTTTISYQGRLADSDGDPVDTGGGGIGMQFCLYDTDVGGSPLWWEDHLSVPVEDGLFSVLLGSRSGGIPIDILASNSTLWLGITVDGDSEMAPREQIASAPYAIIASSVTDGSITTQKIADEAVTQAKLGADVSLEPPDGSITTAKLADDAVTSSKIAHQFGASSQPLLNFVPRQNDSWDYAYSGTAGSYWRGVDISSIVPADAVAVLIRVSYAQAAAPLSQLYIRHKDGTSRAEGALVCSSRQDISAEYGAQRIIYLPGSVKKLEEKTNTHSAQHSIQIAVIGWWEPAHQ